MSILNKRVRFISSDDRFTKLKNGDMGIVKSVDDFGTVHISWDNGSVLGMIREAGDRFEVVL